jgi:hypothetical protein
MFGVDGAVPRRKADSKVAIETKDSERHHARIHQCNECAAWSYADRGPKHEKIVHRRSCDSTGQPGQAAPKALTQHSMERSAAAGTLFRDHDSDDVAKAAA